MKDEYVDVGRLARCDECFDFKYTVEDPVLVLLALNNPRLIKIYKFIKREFKDKEFTEEEIAEKLGLSRITAFSYLNSLYSLGILEKRKKHGKYFYRLSDEL